MPARKLQYDVNVDTGSAISDLSRLGKAGADAGKDIADGFDQAESASKAALDALSAQLDKTEADAKGLAEAVAAIKANLTVDVDDSKVAGFASDLQSKMGVAFDDVKADAKAFADVLERGVDLSKTTGEIRNVGDELGHVRGEADQSRSVLANMAGNAAQDLGALGGVAGTAGVAIGQLAEYATEGGISLGGLAKVAGPMAALSAATLLLTSVVGAFQGRAKIAADQMNTLNDILAAGGDVAGGYADALADVGFTAENASAGVGEFAQSFIKARAGLTDVDGLLTNSGISFRQWGQAITGSRADAQDMQTVLDDLVASGTITADTWEQLTSALAQGRGDWKDAAAGAAALDEAMRFTNSGDMTAALTALQTPLERLRNGIGEVTGPWEALMADARDGVFDLHDAAKAFDFVRTQTGLTQDELLNLINEQIHLEDTTSKLTATTGSYADEQAKVQEAAGRTQEALQGVADTLQANIDAQQHLIDSAAGLADAQQAWDDALAALPGVMDAATDAMNEHTAGTDEWTAARNDARDALQSDVDLFVEATKLQAEQNGQELDSVQITKARAEGLARLAGTVDDRVIPAVADYYAQLFKIPEEKKTEFEVLLLEGDQHKIETFIAENSGTFDTAMNVKILGNSLNIVHQQLDDVAAPRSAPVTAYAATGGARIELNQLKTPITVPVAANTSSANATVSAWRKGQASTAVVIPVYAKTSGSVQVHTSTRSADAAGVDTQAATPTTSTSTPTSLVASAAPATVNLNVHVQAGVIGNRYDVERVVRGAVTDMARLGRLALAAPP